MLCVTLGPELYETLGPELYDMLGLGLGRLYREGPYLDRNATFCLVRAMYCMKENVYLFAAVPELGEAVHGVADGLERRLHAFKDRSSDFDAPPGGKVFV